MLVQGRHSVSIPVANAAKRAAEEDAADSADEALATKKWPPAKARKRSGSGAASGMEKPAAGP